MFYLFISQQKAVPKNRAAGRSAMLKSLTPEGTEAAQELKVPFMLDLVITSPTTQAMMTTRIVGRMKGTEGDLLLPHLCAMEMHEDFIEYCKNGIPDNVVPSDPKLSRVMAIAREAAKDIRGWVRDVGPECVLVVAHPLVLVLVGGLLLGSAPSLSGFNLKDGEGYWGTAKGTRRINAKNPVPPVSKIREIIDTWDAEAEEYVAV